MKKVYLVIANYSGDVSYGIDEHTDLIGIFKSKKEALKKIDEWLLGQEGITQVERIPEDEQEIEYFTFPERRKVLDPLYYHIVEFNYDDDLCHGTASIILIEVSISKIYSDVSLGGGFYLE